MAHRHVPVLIIGAGLAGLSAAALLAYRKIPCLLVERRASTLRHPRARGVNLRSLELLRVVPGLEDDLRRASTTKSFDFSIIIAESVTGRQFRTLLAPGQFDTSSLSPAAICTAGQDRVEPILLSHARRLGAEVCFATELTGFTQDSQGVCAALRNMRSGEEMHVTVDYLIAADGNRSPVRQALGIGMNGKGTLSHNMSILFEADLGPVLADRGFVLYYLQNPDFTGVFVSTDDPGIGQVSVEYDPARESAADYDAARAAHMVRAAMGMPHLDARVLDVMPWEMSALVADRMASGRVFLAGDAAHTMPPTGGLGGQTAIQDAADLAWKLAMVIGGKAGPDLLQTYEAERHPVAALTVARQTANYVERLRPDRGELAAKGGESDYVSVAIGYRYRSSAILADMPDDGNPTEDPLHPTGVAGTRLAHVPLRRDGVVVSTLDLVGDGFVLFAGAQGARWAEAARLAAARRQLRLATYIVGIDILDESCVLSTRAGLAAEGALLVRPDGFIAWRTPEFAADPTAVLGNVLDRILRLSAKEQAA